MLHPIPALIVLSGAFNEQLGIGPTLNEVTSTFDDLRFLKVYANSNYKTVDVAKNQGREVIFRKGIRKGKAISQEIQHVNLDHRCVIFTDDDCTFPSMDVNEC